MKYKGKANENLNYGVIEIDVQALFDYAPTSPYEMSFLSDCGLTTEVINNMLYGKYTKVKQLKEQKIWSYDAHKKTGYTNICFHRGDGGDVSEGLSLSSYDEGQTWRASEYEI
ncbi:MAG: hypothetical protein ACI4N3_04115 [Alphaproteobacteria bacterium]